ncbi:hypothetical protein [Aeromicrobium sp. P5_D10]
MTERAYLEHRLDDNVLLVLDHRVVDIYDASERVVAGGHGRWHVDHLGVEAKPVRGGMKIRVGLRRPDESISVSSDIAKFTVTDQQLPHVLAFFDRAKAARLLL